MVKIYDFLNYKIIYVPCLAKDTKAITIKGEENSYNELIKASYSKRRREIYVQIITDYKVYICM